MRLHVTPPHGGHMDEYTPAIVGKHNARPGIKVKKSLRIFCTFINTKTLDSQYFSHFLCIVFKINRRRLNDD